MIKRSFDVGLLRDATEPYAHELHGFDPEAWLADERNIALTDDGENYNLLEYELPGVYTGHTFYIKRGRAAKAHLHEALRVAFTEFPVEVIRGLTPIKLVGARWMARQGGFKSHGVVQTLVGPCELFILSKHKYLGTG